MNTLYEANTSFDMVDTKQRIGERHPILLMIGKAVILGGMFTIFVVTLSIVLINHATAQQDYANAHAFQPVHYNRQ